MRIRFGAAEFQQEMAEEAARRARAQERVAAWTQQPPAHAEVEEVLIRGRARLLRFRDSEVRRSPPLLIVYSQVNRPYMVDLAPDCSLVNALRAEGLEIYLLDWGAPGPEDAHRSLADYVLGDLDACVDHLRAAHGVPKIDLLAICQGGTLSLCYAGIFPQKLRSLVLTATPVDFHVPEDLLSHLVRGVDIRKLVAAWGNVPGELLNLVFLAQKPLQLGHQKYAEFVRHAHDDARSARFLAMEKWIFDSPALAGDALCEFVEKFQAGNGLVHGGLRFGDQAVDLARIDCPVLNVYARHDHLVPPASSQALRKLLPRAHYEELGLDAGHIGLYVNDSARSRLVERVSNWLRGECAPGKRRAKKLPPGRRKARAPEGRGEVIRDQRPG